MVAVRNTTTSCHYLHRPNIEAIHNLAGIYNGFQYCHIASVKHWLTCSNYKSRKSKNKYSNISQLFEDTKWCVGYKI